MFVSDIAYIKLSDLTKKVRQTIQEAFGDQTFWIVAEVSGHKFYPDSDRHYFDLVEKIESSNTETAKVKANSWERGSRQIALFEQTTGQKFGDGLQVLACVKVNYHIVYGLSLTLVDLDPNFTLGNLERLRKETLRRLLQENPDHVALVDDQYITRNKQLRLNCVIQRIALIGSPRSEGYTDFVHTIDHNQFGYRFAIDYYYSAVQGVSAEQELVSTLIKVYEKSKDVPYDCVVITRGGGAKTDFLVFDTYALSRVVARFPIPIITGIGHHKDVSIVDMMAHTLTKTPTKAAEFILAHNRAFEEQVLNFQNRIIIRSQQWLASHTRNLNQQKSSIAQVVPALLSARREKLHDVRNAITRRPSLLINQRDTHLLKTQQAIINCSRHILNKRSTEVNAVYHALVMRPKEITSRRRIELDTTIRYLGIYSSRFLKSQGVFLQHQQSLMRMMSPANILKRGFAIVSIDDRIITKSSDIEIGSNISIQLDKTDFNATVNTKTKITDHGEYDL